MSRTILSRYLDPATLSRVAKRHVEPRGLVMGNLAGAHKSPLAGFAVEFAGHREYVPGDEPRHIDWRLYFTRDRYFIKQYEMETNFVAHLVLDVSASMRYGDADQQKLSYAASMAATLAFSIAQQNDKVSLATFDDRVRGFIPPSNSMAQMIRMSSLLDEAEPVDKTNMAACLNELAGRMARREIVMIFSDFFTDLDKLEPALQLLRFNQHEVVLFQVMHHDEVAFEFDGMVRFDGLEEPDQYLTQTDDIRQGYLAAVAEFRSKLGDICQRNRVEHVEVDTSRDIAEVLIDYLNHRSLLNRGR
jgi:uncharacterized protein (DUF58 family)